MWQSVFCGCCPPICQAGLCCAWELPSGKRRLLAGSLPQLWAARLPCNGQHPAFGLQVGQQCRTEAFDLNCFVPFKWHRFCHWFPLQLLCMGEAGYRHLDV